MLILSVAWPISFIFSIWSLLIYFLPFSSIYYSLITTIIYSTGLYGEFTTHLLFYEVTLSVLTISLSTLAVAVFGVSLFGLFLRIFAILLIWVICLVVILFNF